MKERVIEMLEEVCEETGLGDNPDLDLFEAGYVDSLGFVELLVEIEDEFGVSFALSEVKREDVSTVNKIVALIEKGGVK